jgi:hypothetical protein
MNSQTKRKSAGHATSPGAIAGGCGKDATGRGFFYKRALMRQICNAFGAKLLEGQGRPFG